MVHWLESRVYITAGCTKIVFCDPSRSLNLTWLAKMYQWLQGLRKVNNYRNNTMQGKVDLLLPWHTSDISFKLNYCLALWDVRNQNQILPFRLHGTRSFGSLRPLLSISYSWYAYFNVLQITLYLFPTVPNYHVTCTQLFWAYALPHFLLEKEGLILGVCICCERLVLTSSYLESDYEGIAAHGSAVGWGTIGSFPMVSLEFFIDIILPTAPWPWDRLNLYQKWVPGIFPGGKGGRCVGLTTLPPSCADFLEIWEP